MKLRTKLLLKLGIVIFVAINLFSYILIQSSFNSNLNVSVDSGFNEYSVIYANIKTGESLQKLFLTNKEILEIKSTEYIKSQDNRRIEMDFRDEDNKIIYTTSNNNLNFNNSIFNTSGSEAKYTIFQDLEARYLAINSTVMFNGTKLKFTYIKDISNIYITKNENLKNLIWVNVVLALILLVILYMVTYEITKPIELLIENMDEVIKGNYNKKLSYSSNIKELQAISINFNLMNDEIQNKIKDLQEQNLLKQKFIDNLTHEIRTPLTSIIGYSSLMVSKNIQDVDMMHNSFDAINKDGKRILALTSNLIKLITLNKSELNIENVSVFNIVKEIESSFSFKMQEKNVDFKITGEDYKLKIDKELLIILLSNFIDNAIKSVYSTTKKEVSILLTENKITIKDTGVGISKENISKIFEPFYMVDKSREKSINGFGLGLSICKEIINIFDINFSIVSNVGEGTEINLMFNENDII